MPMWYKLFSYALFHLIHCSESSVAHSDQIVTQLLDGIGGSARLNGFGIVCNEKGLFCLDDDDTGLALFAFINSISLPGTITHTCLA